MAYTVQQLLAMSQADLDALFSASSTGDIPTGEAAGTAIIAPGTVFSQPIAQLINLFAWQGKNFDPASGTLRNRILAFGISAVIAKVYQGDSWFDGKPCIVIDYSETSFIAERVRDEIRPIGNGLYLGNVFWSKTRIFNFALQFPAAGA